MKKFTLSKTSSILNVPQVQRYRNISVINKPLNAYLPETIHEMIGSPPSKNVPPKNFSASYNTYVNSSTTFNTITPAIERTKTVITSPLYSWQKAAYGTHAYNLSQYHNNKGNNLGKAEKTQDNPLTSSISSNSSRSARCVNNSSAIEKNQNNEDWLQGRHDVVVGNDTFDHNLYDETGYYDCVDLAWRNGNNAINQEDFMLGTETQLDIDLKIIGPVQIPTASRACQVIISIFLSRKMSENLNLLKKCIEYDNGGNGDNIDANGDMFPRCCQWTFSSIKKDGSIRISKLSIILENLIYYILKLEMFDDIKAVDLPCQKELLDYVIANNIITMDKSNNNFVTNISTELSIITLGMLERLMLANRFNSNRFSEVLANMSLSGSQEKLRNNMRLMKDKIWGGEHKKIKQSQEEYYNNFQTGN